MSDPILLPNLTHLRFRGPDAERYLNGQITQKVDGLPTGSSRHTFVCDAKGRILFDATVYRDDEGYLLTVEGGDSDDIFARLDRYLIADDCELIDESERWNLLHQIDEETSTPINRYGTAGYDRYLIASNLTSLDAPTPEDLNKLEDLRIRAGVPRLQDLAERFPAETGYEESAVSYHKGCYLGQEVISRMKRAGRVNWALKQLSLPETPSSLPLNFYGDNSQKPLLTVTSAASKKSEHGVSALGYLNSKVSPETQLRSEEGLSVTV